MSLHSPYLGLCIICWNYPACSNIVHARLQLFVSMLFCHVSVEAGFQEDCPASPEAAADRAFSRALFISLFGTPSLTEFPLGTCE